MPRAMQVAKVFLDLAGAGAELDPVSNLRLQKLLYYAQGWSLALRNKVAFSDRIEAWALGPVVPNVYHALKSYGYGEIPQGAIEAPPLSDEDAAFVAAVWDAYKPFSATKLSAMTHEEEPWIKARGERASSEACNEAITHESLKKYYVAKKKASAKSA